MASYTLVCSFLTDDPVFAHGVEFGLLYAKMRSGVLEIKDYFSLENQEQILLLANRLNWHVQEIHPWGNQWFWCFMEQNDPGRADAGV